MNTLLKKLMLEAGYAAPELAKRAQRLAVLIVLECEKQAKLAGNDRLREGELSHRFGVENPETFSKQE